MNTFFSQFLLELVFLTIISLHLTKSNLSAAIAYSLQSFVVVLLLIVSYFSTGNTAIIFVALLTLLVKVIVAPFFFTKLIYRLKLKFPVSTYLNTPFTLIAVTILTFVAYSEKFFPLTRLVPENQAFLSLALSSLFLSLFLIINRKGALSQIFGFLSFENSIVAFSIFAGLEQSPALQFGIIFNIFVWFLIATAFVYMIYKHFGTIDITSLKHLTD